MAKLHEVLTISEDSAEGFVHDVLLSVSVYNGHGQQKPKRKWLHSRQRAFIWHSGISSQASKQGGGVRWVRTHPPNK